MDERDYTMRRWHVDEGAVVDIDERVVDGGDFSEWTEKVLNGE